MTDGALEQGAGVRVLVADDTEHVRRILVEMLTLDGFDIVGEAQDGAAAVRLTLELEPHVVVMDMQMPVFDGLEATRRIREVRTAQQVVLYTAYLDDALQLAAREAGVAVCLGKVEGLPRLAQELSRLTLAVARRV